MKKLFTERHGMGEPRVKDEFDVTLTKGLLTVIIAKIDENLFGEAFSTGWFASDPRRRSPSCGLTCLPNSASN